MTTTYGPYSPVRQVGELLFVSGQVGIDPVTGLANGSVSKQTTQLLQNMNRALAEHGATLQDVVKTTVFLTNMDDFAEMNTAYQAAFAAPRPARSTVAVKELPRLAGATPIRVEIEAIAHRVVR